MLLTLTHILMGKRHIFNCGKDTFINVENTHFYVENTHFYVENTHFYVEMTRSISVSCPQLNVSLPQLDMRLKDTFFSNHSADVCSADQEPANRRVVHCIQQRVMSRTGDRRTRHLRNVLQIILA